MRRKIAALIAAVLLMTAGCGSRDSAQSERRLVIFAAASLAPMFEELSERFGDAHPGVEVVLNFAGSQQLAAQIRQGAGADLFAAAEPVWTDRLAAEGLTAPAAVFAHNRLAVVVSAEAKERVRTLHQLSAAGLKLVIGAPEVPVGHYAALMFEALAADPAYGADFVQSVRANVVSFEQSVSAIYAKVRFGEVDAGVVYASDVVREGADELGWIAVPVSLSPTIAYTIAITRDADDAALTRRFVDDLLSPDGQAVLRRYHFLPADPAATGGVK